MHAYGDDRVEPASHDGFVIIARAAKGWQGRRAKTNTSSEHPGTAVLWDDALFEVVSVHETEMRFRYHLVPWRDEHTVRLTHTYDAAHENARAAERRDQHRRHKRRFLALMLAPLTGSLPSAVQEHYGREYSILPVRLTMISLLLPVAFGVWVANRAVGNILHPGRAGLPLWIAFLAMFLFGEGMLRMFVVFSQSRPIGTALGFVGYCLFWLAHPRREQLVHPFAEERGFGLYRAEFSAEAERHDRYIGLEPLLTLLPAEDQKLLAARFAFDYRAHANTIAVVLLCFAIAGAVTSWNTVAVAPTFSARSSFIVAIIVGGEQLWRLVALRRGPAGSMFGLLVRPFARILFEPKRTLTRARDSHPESPRGASE